MFVQWYSSCVCSCSCSSHFVLLFKGEIRSQCFGVWSQWVWKEFTFPGSWRGEHFCGTKTGILPLFLALCGNSSILSSKCWVVCLSLVVATVRWEFDETREGEALLRPSGERKPSFLIAEHLNGPQQLNNFPFLSAFRGLTWPLAHLGIRWSTQTPMRTKREKASLTRYCKRVFTI